MLSDPASALAPSEAAVSFHSGRFLEAAEAGRAEGGEGLSLAARGLLAQVVTGEAGRETDQLIEQAVRLSEQLLARRPNSAAARLDLAFALGLQARRLGKLEAFRKGYAPRGRRLIEEALAIEPDNAWAHAMLGGWHCEVLRRGGRMGAKLYGARFGVGTAEFEQARALAPHDPSISLQYAVALLGVDPERYARQARDLLNDSAAARPSDAFQKFMVREAQRLGALMDAKGARAAAEEASRRFA